MAPSTSEELRRLNILLYDVLYDTPDDGPDLQNVKTKQEWRGIMEIFWKMIKLRGYFRFPPMEMIRGGSEGSPIGETLLESIINYSIALGGFFRSSLIFATKIRLNQRIIEKCGNPQTGEGGWWYRDVPPSFDEIVKGPILEDNRNLLIATIRELSKTWDRFLFKKFYMILTSSSISYKSRGGLDFFIRSLINYNVLSFAQINTQFRNFYSEYEDRNDYPPGGDIEEYGIILNNELRTIRPPNFSEIEQNQLWIDFIDLTFGKEQWISIIEKLIDMIDFTRSETAANILIKYIVNIIIANKDTFRFGILEEFIFYSMEKYLVNGPRRPNGKSVTNIFTLAMMEVQKYILRNAAATRIATRCRARRNYSRIRLPSRSSSQRSRPSRSSSQRSRYGQPISLGYLSRRRRQN